MRVTFDEASDALYLRLDDTPIAESETVRPGVVLDYDAKDRVVGVEILGLIDRIDRGDLRSMHFELA
ncbi:MAG: DUF2283 domain-containing protein [Thermoleophilia bacterium]|nr:DUF2283 domain-containing protein [Thermoleophilia bacterium]